jgi:hypothetical protein
MALDNCHSFPLQVCPLSIRAMRWWLSCFCIYLYLPACPNIWFLLHAIGTECFHFTAWKEHVFTCVISVGVCCVHAHIFISQWQACNMHMVGSLLGTLCKCWPYRASSNLKRRYYRSRKYYNFSACTEQLLYMEKIWQESVRLNLRAISNWFSVTWIFITMIIKDHKEKVWRM